MSSIGPSADAPKARQGAAFYGVILLVVAVLATATAREATIGREELLAADAAAAHADWPEAIEHARAAAQARAPGGFWAQRGRLRLEAIGHDAEARGDDSTALLAYGALRTAALSTRALGSTNAQWRAQAEEGLARVAAAQRDGSAPRVTTAALLDDLRRDDAPPLANLALLAAGTIAMLAGLAALAFRAALAPPRRAAQALAVAGFVAYVVALVSA
jgi:hypothetical protein